MKARTVLVALAKVLAIVFLTIAATFVMAKLNPPPKGTAFDGLKYILQPVYISLFAGLVYLIAALSGSRHEKRLFLGALLVSVIYVVLLFLHVV